METVTWSEPRRLARAALAGVGVAFSGVVLSLFLGIGASDAHAAPDDERGLVGAVTGLLDGTTALVGSTVSGAASTVSETVGAIVEVAPTPIQKPVQAVGQVVDTTVSTVTAPVQQVVSSGLVSAVTTPVVSVVTEVPVVGTVVTGLGVDAVLGGVASGVDSTLETTVDAVTTVGGVLAPAASDNRPIDDVPPPPTSTTAWSAPFAPVDLADIVATTSRDGDSAAFSRAAASGPTASIADHPVGESVSTSPHEAPTLPTLAGDPTTAATGPAGAGSGAWALAALLPFAAHRAWVRRAGPGDDTAPPAPADPTDASPD